MLKKNILYNVVIGHDLYISELYIEIHRLTTISSNFVGSIFIPPIVFAFFLQYLCQRKLENQRNADEALYELSLLLDIQHYGALHIPNGFRGISWQILGICQQMNGHDWEACRSYLTVLQQDTFDEIKMAACVRLGTLLVKYF